MSENIRIGLGVLSVVWLGPVLAFAFIDGVLALMRDARPDPPPVLLLVHRGLPALILLAGVITSSWALVAAAFATAAVTTLTVEVVKRRWPEHWVSAGEVGS